MPESVSRASFVRTATRSSNSDGSSGGVRPETPRPTTGSRSMATSDHRSPPNPPVLFSTPHPHTTVFRIGDTPLKPPLFFFFFFFFFLLIFRD